MDSTIEMNKLYQIVLNSLQENRNNILAGNVNCIPSPFKRFRQDFVGIQKGMYYLVSATQKCGKSKFTRFMFLYHPILYAYNNPSKIQIRIFYYPLEESKEQIIQDFLCYLLYIYEGKVICPIDLESANETKPVSQEILDLLHTEKYTKVLDFFNEHVEFCEGRNPTSLWKKAISYAESNGKYEYSSYIDNDGNTKQKIERYIPNNPDEYVEFIWDHVSLTESERGFDLRETIKKLSQYMVVLRDNYKYISVAVQQQSTETQSLDAFKANKIRPTKAGLADCKDTGNDCSMMIGLSNPYAFELPSYLGYDITQLRDRARFFEVVLSRKGSQNGIAPLFFLGECEFFRELPLPNDSGKMQEVYNYIQHIKGLNETIVMFTYSIKQSINKFKKLFKKWQLLLQF